LNLTAGKFIAADTWPAIVLIAAVADNGVIGRGNDMPWRLKSDLAHFRALTIGKPVIMGRKTYRSIGKPLAGRTTIVVSRDRAFAAPDVLVATGFHAAIDAARGEALRRSADTIVIAGGAEIYAQALPCADRLEITHVRASPEGDTVFPAIDGKIWREHRRADHPAGPFDDYPFAFVTYERM
jgi:dihydrofolate reductase